MGTRRKQSRADQIARLSRGLCPIHGACLVQDSSGVMPRGGFRMHESCSRSDCLVVVQPLDGGHYVVLTPKELRGLTTKEHPLVQLAKASDETQ